MKNKIDCLNETDIDGNPGGGSVKGNGIDILWQAGPLPRDEHGNPLNKPNGAFVEDVIIAAIQRLEFFNSSKYKCRQNSLAITKLEEALLWLNHRSNERINRGVYGLNIP